MSKFECSAYPSLMSLMESRKENCFSCKDGYFPITSLEMTRISAFECLDGIHYAWFDFSWYVCHMWCIGRFGFGSIEGLEVLDKGKYAV